MSVSARIAGLAVGVIALGGGLAACNDDDGEAAELRAELAEVTAERDELQGHLDAVEERHDKAVETVETLRGILDDPASYGSEEEVVDLLASLATPSAQMRDDAFGDVGIRSAWYNTLYRGAADAEIEVIHQWFDPDGSTSGSLWVWRGTNSNGNPFELIGVNVTTHDDEGRIADSWVIYPYPDEYVAEGFTGEGTEVSGMWGD